MFFIVVVLLSLVVLILMLVFCVLLLCLCFVWLVVVWWVFNCFFDGICDGYGWLVGRMNCCFWLVLVVMVVVGVLVVFSFILMLKGFLL